MVEAQQATAMTRPLALDLFAGAGGADLGLHAAGLRTVAYELDPDAANTLRTSAPARVVVEADVRAVAWATWARAAVRLLWGSPPCQAWSTAGKSLGAADPRNMWPDTLRIIDTVRPEWVALENVPGMRHHQKATHPSPTRCKGCYFDTVVEQLRAIYPWVDVWELNAADYAVPQHRRRIFLVAGPEARTPPTPTHSKHGDAFTLPWVSCGEALGLTVVGGGANPHYPGDARTERDPATTISAQSGGSNSQPKVVERPNWWHRASPLDEPSRAIGSRANASILGAGRASDILPMSGSTRRRLTIAECAILQGFPEGYVFTGNKTEQYRQVGNAVPPILAEVVARALIP